MDELFAQNQTQEPRYMYDENDVLIEAPPVPASDALKRGMFSIANLFGLYPRTEEEKRAAAIDVQNKALARMIADQGSRVSPFSNGSEESALFGLGEYSSPEEISVIRALWGYK